MYSGGNGLYRPLGPARFNKSSPFARGLVAWWPAGPTSQDIAQSPPYSGVQIVPVIPELVDGAHAYFEMNGVDNTLLRRAASPMGFVAQHVSSGFETWYEAPIKNGRWDFTRGEGTIAFWCRRFEATPVSNQDVFFPFGFNGNEGDSGSLYPWTDGQLYCGIMDTTRVLNGVALRSDVDRTTWHLVSVSSKAGTNNYRFFQNGKLAAQTTRNTFSSTLDAAGLVLMGNRSVFGVGKFAGQACDWRVWNRAFSDREHQDLYDQRSRWDLYERSTSRVFAELGAGGGGSAGPGGGAGGGGFVDSSSGAGSGGTFWGW